MKPRLASPMMVEDNHQAEVDTTCSRIRIFAKIDPSGWKDKSTRALRAR